MVQVWVVEGGWGLAGGWGCTFDKGWGSEGDSARNLSLQICENIHNTYTGAAARDSKPHSIYYE